MEVLKQAINQCVREAEVADVILFLGKHFTKMPVDCDFIVNKMKVFVKHHRCQFIKMLFRRKFYRNSAYRLVVREEVPPEYAIFDSCEICKRLSQLFGQMVEINDQDQITDMRQFKEPSRFCPIGCIFCICERNPESETWQTLVEKYVNPDNESKQE